MESIFFGFKEILNYKTMKMALMIGIGVTLVWSLIGYLIWDGLVAFGAYFIDLVPFSMIRANGAWMLATFFWIALVLITFALILAFFGNMILEKVSKEKYSSFSLIIVLGSALFWGALWFLNMGYIHTQFLKLLNWLPFETVEAGLSYILGFYFIYGAIIVTLLFATSFFSETLLKDISKKHFRYEPLLEEDEIETSENRFMDIGIYTVVSIVVFPLLFIPVVNFIIQIALWTWLIKDTFVVDSAALLLSRNEQKILQEHKAGLVSISMVTTLFNFVPFFNIFGPFFGEITMFYYVRLLKQNYRAGKE